MLRFLARFLMVGGLVLFATAAWLRDSVPPAAEFRPEIFDEPVQKEIRKAAFDTTVNGVTYKVQPLYTYDLHGLVVSRHSADSFIDYLHRAWNDSLNVIDLCVIWGDNLKADLGGMSFSSGQFQCFWEAKSQEVWNSFDQFQISNNHLLTDKSSITKRLRNVRVGDQVRFRGYLAEYSHNQGLPFKRGTSIVRTDTGNGACETVWVEDFENLKVGGGPWRTLFWVGLGLLALGALAWVAAPPKLN